jgi:hypothetical protein
MAIKKSLYSNPSMLSVIKSFIVSYEINESRLFPIPFIYENCIIKDESIVDKYINLLHREGWFIYKYYGTTKCIILQQNSYDHLVTMYSSHLPDIGGDK